MLVLVTKWIDICPVVVRSPKKKASGPAFRAQCRIILVDSNIYYVVQSVTP